MALDKFLIRRGFDWRYFAATAKVMHVWRDNARKFFLVACIKYGDQVGVAQYRKMPPRPIAGRWGRIDDVEDKLMLAEDTLPLVVRKVLCKEVATNETDEADVARPVVSGGRGRGRGNRGRGRGGRGRGMLAIADGDVEEEDLADLAPPAPPAVETGHATFEDPRAESQEQYRIKMGIWRKHALAITHDKAFWVVTRIAHIARQPLTHHRHFVTSRLTNSDVEVRGNHQAQLTCGKAETIFLEFGDILERGVHSWAPMVLARSTAAPKSEFLRLAVELVCCHAAGYRRRVVRPLLQFSMLLLWLAFKRHNQPCNARRYVASIVLRPIPEAPLDGETLKVLAIYLVDFRAAATTGMCSVHLWAFAQGIRTYLRSDTQINEGYNSMMKRTIERNKHIGLPLLDARCDLRASLGVYGNGQAGASAKWSNVRPRAIALLNECLRHFDRGQAIADDENRWAPTTSAVPSVTMTAAPPPMPTTDGHLDMPSSLSELAGAGPKRRGRCQPNDDDAVVVDDDDRRGGVGVNYPLLPPAAREWAAAFNSCYHAACRTPDARIGVVCVGGSGLEAGGSLYFCSDTHYSLHEMVRCTLRLPFPFEPCLDEEMGEPDLIAVISHPLDIRPLNQIFAEYHDVVHHGRQVIAVTLFALTWRYSGKHGLFAEVRHPTELFDLRKLNRASAPKKRSPPPPEEPSDGPSSIDREAVEGVSSSGGVDSLSPDVLQRLEAALLKRELGEAPDDDEGGDVLEVDKTMSEELLVRRHEEVQLATARVRKKCAPCAPPAPTSAASVSGAAQPSTGAVRKWAQTVQTSGARLGDVAHPDFEEELDAELGDLAFGEGDFGPDTGVDPLEPKLLEL